MKFKFNDLFAVFSLPILFFSASGFAQSDGMSFVKTDTGDFLGVEETPQGEATFVVFYRETYGYACGPVPTKCKDSIRFSSQLIDQGTRGPFVNASLERTDSVVLRVCYPSGKHTGGFWDKAKKDFSNKPYDVISLETVDCEFAGSPKGGVVLKSDSGIQEMNPITMDAARQKAGNEGMMKQVTQEQNCDLVIYYRACQRM